MNSAEIEFIPIKKVRAGDYAMSLNEETGVIEPHRINGLLDMGVKPVFRLTTASGRTIRTTGNHPYLVKNFLRAEKSAAEKAGFELEGNIMAGDSGIESAKWLRVAGLSEGDEIAVAKEELFTGQNKIAHQGDHTSLYDTKKRHYYHEISNEGINEGRRHSFENFSQIPRHNNLTFKEGKEYSNLAGPEDEHPADKSCFSLRNLDFQTGFGFHQLLTDISSYFCKPFLKFPLCDFESFVFGAQFHLVKHLNQSFSALVGEFLSKNLWYSNYTHYSSFLVAQKIYHSVKDLSSLFIAPRVEAQEIISSTTAINHNLQGVSFPTFNSSVRLVNRQLPLSSPNILWDKIVSIEYLGYEQVYDIEVEGTHNFVAGHWIEVQGKPSTQHPAPSTKFFGGIIAHNTYMSGNVGIGTTSPATGNKLHVEGQCITGDTLLPVIRAGVGTANSGEGEVSGSFKLSHLPNNLPNPDLSETREVNGLQTREVKVEFIPIVEVKPGDFVLSLNEETGKIEPHRIKGLLDMGVKPVFKLTTEDGRTIRTTGNHPYLVKGNLTDEKRETIAQERIKTIAQKQDLSIEDFSAEKEFSETRFVWQDSRRDNSVTHLAMVDVSDKDSVRFPENKFNAVIADAQPKFLELSTLQLNHLSMLEGVIELADFFNFSDDARLLFNRKAGQFLFSGRVKEIIEHRDGYLDAFSLFLSRLSTSLAGIHEPVRSAVFTRASVSLMDSCEDNSMKSTTSSKSSLERTLDGASTPRRFLSSIIVKCRDLFIQNKYNTFLNNLSRKNWESYFGVAYASIPKYTDEVSAQWLKVIYLKEGDEIAVYNEPTAMSNEPYVAWDKISSIRYIGYEQVYDIEVEGTHNFIANGIVAHNTYISSNLGIGTTAPSARLHSQESGAKTAANYAGYLENLSTNTTTDNITKYGSYISSTGNFVGGTGPGTRNFGLYVDSTSGADSNVSAYFANNVGIGTTAPAYTLHVAGDIKGTTIYGNIAEGTVTPTGFTSGSVVFAGSGGTLAQDNANFYWDDTNNRLGIGTTSPGYLLTIVSRV